MMRVSSLLLVVANVIVFLNNGVLGRAAALAEYFEWDGRTVVRGDSVKDMTAKVITARYRGDLYSDSHFLALRTYRDKLSQHLRHLGWLEECRDLMDIWVQSMSAIGNGTRRAEGIFVDVGANIGACSIYFASKSITTLAFEPLPSNLYYFTKAVLLNREKSKHDLKQLRIFKVALGATDKPQEVQLNVQRDNSGNAMVGPEFVVDTDHRLSAGGMFYTSNVTTISYDALLPLISGGGEDSPLHLLKLDCQGSETDVLKGMKEVLSDPNRRPTYIYTELDPVRLEAMSSSVHKLIQLLVYHGYKSGSDGISWDNLFQELKENERKKGTLASMNILARLSDAPTIKLSRFRP